MSESNYDLDALLQDVGTVSGSYVKWGEPGESHTGIIVSFDLEGGTDFNQEVVPQLVLSVDGDNKIINGSQARLRQRMRDGAPKLKVGHLCRVTFTGWYEASKGQGKDFSIECSPEPVMVDVVTKPPVDDSEF